MEVETVGEMLCLNNHHKHGSSAKLLGYIFSSLPAISGVAMVVSIDITCLLEYDIVQFGRYYSFVETQSSMFMAIFYPQHADTSFILAYRTTWASDHKRP